MTDERLVAMLGSFRQERMDRIADDRIRTRLEHAWTARAERRTWSLRLRSVAPIVATLVLFVGLATATMRSSGDSLLYGVRVAVEDAAAGLYGDPQDRAQYLLALLDQRQAEAARLEASGNALAAARVRAVEESTLRRVQALLPEAPDAEPAPADPSESPSPSPSPSATPTASQTASPSPAPTSAATPARTATPRPATATPRPPSATPRPTVAPTGTLMAVRFAGVVKNPDGTTAANVCVRFDPNSPTCLQVTGADGSYGLLGSARLDQTVTVYFTRPEGAILYKAWVSAVVKSAQVTMPDAKLQK